jgi:NAD(P)-dependent dehydrogenase (short-subunit alcohol dehydrogenase family)
VLSHFGRVDVLVNNAGIYFESPIELDEATWRGHWDRMMAVNLTAAAMLCRAAIRHFKERGGGRIVNISSRAAFRGETEHYLAYGASKGGMVSLSRSIARSFGTYNIKSFVIAPGWVRTPMTEELLGEIEQELVEHELALNELTEIDDITPIVVLIASGKLDHATGCTIDINAGSYIR